MATKPFRTTLDPKQYFEGLARQALDFHSALGELIDNSLSARTRSAGGTVQNITIEITVEQISAALVRIQVADEGIGIPIDDLAGKIFNLGGQGTAKGQLNEHGFGLKNALALLTGGNSTKFTLLTRCASDGLEPDQFHRVEGPLSLEMSVDDAATRKDWQRDLTYLGDAPTGTKLIVEVPWTYFRTVYKRGNPGLDVLVARLGEHIGVMHRYFVQAGNVIKISYRGIGGDWVHKEVQPIFIPFEGEEKTTQHSIDVNGVKHSFTYRRGVLDYTTKSPDAEEERGWPYPLRSYYQGSNARCGIDIVVRDRVIKTGVFEEIWPETAKTVDFNRFIGELRVGDQFRTTNNKTGLDPHAANWERLLEHLDAVDFSPEKATKSESEKSLRTSLVHILQGTFTGASVVHERKVWAGAIAIDIYVDGGEGNRRVYELKVTDGRVLDLYQLLAGWDGLVKENIQPTIGILVVKDYGQTLVDAVEEANQRQDKNGRPYKVELRRASELVPIYK